MFCQHLFLFTLFTKGGKMDLYRQLEGGFYKLGAKVMGVPHPPAVGFGMTGRSN